MTNDRLYARARTLFEDSESNSYYVLLTRTSQVYSRIENAFKNPFKILLITGAPGTGKSYVLRRFYYDQRDRAPIFMYPSATFASDRLCEIYEKLYNKRLAAKDTQEIIDAFRDGGLSPIFILLDEAQLYESERLEWVRMLSNEEIFRFVVVVHRVKQEDLLAKEHFRTRTFETIECRPIEPAEISRFIETKLLLGEVSEFYDRFNQANFDRIYDLTQGNLRDLNRLMNRFFDLLDDYEQNRPHKLTSRFSNKFIEMAAIELGML
ncbi:MAG: ATP-binding protein [Helicobacteraceae bacterium]|jgi:4-hydroxy-tetrahydrodipicolinate synthase|nr:ATP-binding protein [Helicobacteraceae bacterium]